MAKRSNKKPLEAVRGTYSAIPHSVLDSKAFTGASLKAKGLLFELLRQLNGHNNGHLQLTTSWLKKRDWNSSDTIQTAKNELVDRGLIMQTRQGGRNLYCSWYAVTWLAISDFTGLDIQQKDYHPGKWQFMDNPPVKKTVKAVPLSGAGNTANWYSPVP
jgi:hypothetical protein